MSCVEIVDHLHALTAVVLDQGADADGRAESITSVVPISTAPR